LIAKRLFEDVDGSTNRFLSDFIIRSENFCRPYAYVYDETLNPDGSEDVLQDIGSDWGFPDNLYKRGNNAPKSADLVTVDKWQIVDNSVLYYEAPTAGSYIWVEVASSSEEFGETLTAPSVERAEAAADNAAASAVLALASETAAATSETNSAASEAAASTSETNSAASEVAAATSETNSAASEVAAATSETNSAASEVAAATSETNSAASEAAAATSETNSAASAAAASTSETNAALSETNALASEVAAANSASSVGEVPGVINNGTLTSGALALATTEVTGSMPILYTGNGTSQDVPVHGGVIGNELVTNGHFTTDTTGWTSSTGDITHEIDKIRITRNGTQDPIILQTISTIIGKTYSFSAELINTTAVASMRISGLVSTPFTADAKVYNLIFVATASSHEIQLICGSSNDGEYAEFDNVLVKEVPLMQIANDNGDGSTLAQPWTNVASYAIGGVAIDDSASGDQLAYRNLTGTNSSTNPRLDTTNWVLETNQYGGRFWFKDRDAANNNQLFDSIRRAGNWLSSDTTVIEGNDTTRLSTINVSSLSIGSSSELNTNSNDCVVWVDQTTRKTAGYRTDAGDMQNSKNNTGTDLMATDSAGNPIIEHYNPTTGFSIIMDTGNGVAGRSIPHSLQSKPGFFVKKSLELASSNWYTYNNVKSATDYMSLNATTASTPAITVWNDTEPTDDNYTVGDNSMSNGSGNQHITYLQADSDNHYIGAYTGTGEVGNVVDFGLDMTVDGSYVMVKRLDGVSDWSIVDTLRGNGDDTLFANLSVLESVGANYVDFTSIGIVITSTSITVNASGGLYLIQAYSPKYNQPTGGKDITVNSGIDLTYTQGIGLTNLQETTTAHTVDVSSFAGETAYILKERGSDALGFVQNLGVGQSRIDADRWGTVNGDYRTTDRHGDYESATGIISESQPFAAYYPYFAFDKSSGVSAEKWAVDTTTVSWLQYDTIVYKKLKSFRLASSDDITETPKRWKLTAVNESGTRIDVFTDYESSDFPIPDAYTFSPLLDVSSTSLLRAFRIEITLNNGDASYTSIGELEFNFEVSDAPYLNTLDKVVYDSGDVATNLVALGECKSDGQGNAYDLVEYEPLQSYFNAIVVQGEANLNANVKIVDFGTVFKNNRYVIDNPFGNENYEGCIVRCEVFVGGIWSGTGIGNDTGTGTTGYGAKGYSNLAGIIVQTGANAVYTASAYMIGGTGYTGTQVTSAPCRVIVTKIATEVQDA